MSNKKRATLYETGSILFIIGISLLAIALSYALKNQLFATIFFITFGVGLVIICFSYFLISNNRDTYIYEKGPIPSSEFRSSLEVAMECAWRDHHHARNQTWKSLHVEAILTAALIGINFTSIDQKIHYLPVIGSILIVFLSISGIMIATHHRELERRKFRHIMHCEDALGIRDYIDKVKLPRSIFIWEVFFIWKSNTVLFIMRMHFIILIFAIWYGINLS